MNFAPWVLVLDGMILGILLIEVALSIERHLALLAVLFSVLFALKLAFVNSRVQKLS